MFGDICPFKVDLSLDISHDSGEILIGNLECPLTDNPITVEKAGPVLYCHPDLASKLVSLGFYGVSLANNHIRDCGDEGVFNTIKVCGESGLRTFGADAVNAKLNALSLYRGVMRPYPHPRSDEFITGLAAYRGGQFHMNYAEAFEVVLRRY